ncbi:MAG: SDR family NAD(P)-dependent oxidoreductase [Thermoleophilaceae bacterium]|nr:SDR family NAD(P)-dependent oxidoreductase [Thermoleophilaceae bacterium]
MELTGVTALVTGSNRGIGRAIAEALVQRPLGLVLCGMRDPSSHRPLDPPPGGAREVRPVAVDLSDRESIERSAASLPPVDLLINNAGRMTGGLLEEQDVEEIYAMFQVNLVGLVHLTRLLLPGMVERDRGKVVNNASISGYAWFPAASTYAAAKTGVVAFSESLRRELEPTGVSVLHLVTPGVATDMLDDTREVYGRHMEADAWDAVPPEEWAERVRKAIENDDHVLGPGGRLALAKLASRGPASLVDALSKRMFSRDVT